MEEWRMELKRKKKLKRRWWRGAQFILVWNLRWNIFRDSGILILFRLRKFGVGGLRGRWCSWEKRPGLLGRGVMDIPQDEVGHCSLSVVKRALWRNWWSESRGGREMQVYICERRWGRREGLHYSVILLKMPLKDSPREVGRKGKQMECDNRKMPLMVVSLRHVNVERQQCPQEERAPLLTFPAPHVLHRSAFFIQNFIVWAVCREDFKGWQSPREKKQQCWSKVQTCSCGVQIHICTMWLIINKLHVFFNQPHRLNLILLWGHLYNL